MRYQINISEEDVDPVWDDYVYNSVNGHYTQMALWAKVKAVQGWKPIRVTFWDDGQLIGGAQILWRAIRLDIRIGYVSKGPVLQSDDPEFTKQVLLDIQKIAKEYRLILLAVQPPNGGGHIEELLPSLNMNLNYQGNIEKPATMRIDLSPDLDQIQKNIHSNKRKWIRRIIRNGFDIQDGTRDYLPQFYELHKRTADRNTFDVQSLEFFQILWDTFTPRNMAHLFLCIYEGNVISASLSILFKDTIESFRSGWTGEHSQVHPNETIIWQKIIWGKEHGFHWLDFGGLDLEIARQYLKLGQIPDGMMDSYSAYKLHYGGEVLIFPQTYEYLYHPVARWIYNSINNFPHMQSMIKNGYRIVRNR